MATRRERTLADIRYIKPETICIGDKIKIRFSTGDMEQTRTGTVAKREHFGRNTSEVRTAEGYVLLEWFTDGTTSPPNAVVTLIHRPAPDRLTLDIAV